MSRSDLRTGVLQHRGTFGFVLSPARGDKDVFVRGPSLRLAMDGDLVEVACRDRGGRPDGEIVRVLKRSKTVLVGELKSVGGKWWLAAAGGGEAPWTEVEGFDAVKPLAGRLAAGRVTRWPTMKAGAACVVVELLGRPGDPGVRTRAIVRSLGIRDRFPDEVLAEARSFPHRVSREMARGRLDLSGSKIFTIDGADAKDFDDAVSLERLGGGNVRLGVHIADVSHYVTDGSAIDREAKERGTSVYLPGRVIPMLPPNLSDHLCSLMPNVERLAFSCFLELDGAGNVLKKSFAESVIRSRRRFTYEEVQALLEGGRVEDVPGDVREAVLAMGRLAKTLTRRRLGRGALDIDMPEYQIEVTDAGAPVAIRMRERLDSHRLIEEFMILANEAVASRLIERGRSFPSRVHEDPDPEKLAALQEDLRKLGVPVEGNLAARGNRGLQDVLKRISNHPLRDVLGVMVMRSLKQAVYSEKPLGHFGLASKAYCHFTSPIRRYPDLVTHRVLKEDLAAAPPRHGRRPGRGRGRKHRVRAQGSGMAETCAHSSERERAAVSAERQVVAVLRAEFLKKQTGREVAGVVLRSSPSGVFVEIAGTGAVGLVRGGKTRIGTAVRARIKGVNEDRGEIELEIVRADHAAPASRQANPRRERRRRRK